MIVIVLTARTNDYMTTSSKEFCITHCIVCDESPPCSADFPNHIIKLVGQGLATIQWTKCENCRHILTSDDTMCLVTFNIDGGKDG